MNEVEYLLSLINGLVSKQEEVSIVKTVDEKGVLLTVSVARDDMGKVIGKMGVNAKAIRTIMHAFGYNAKQIIFVKILEPIN